MTAVRLYDPKERDSLDEMCGRSPGEFEWLGAFVLPPFQRPPVWSMEQNIRFLESCWLGYDIGRYTIVQRHGKLDRWDMCLIDGQQRVRALLGYMGNMFPIFGYHFNEVTERDRRHFQNLVFARAVLTDDDLDEPKLRDIYNRLNYGGTPHTEDQRA